MSIHTFDNPVLNSAIKKTWRRLMPFMFIMYFVAFIDRVNIGFAKDAFAADINLSNEAYALGAGIFFASYALCGVPANLMMNKLGAKHWLGATTMLWGLLSALTGFVTNEIEFIILRFVLGMAEACFYPGMGKRRWKVGDRNPNYHQFSAHSALLHVEAYEPIIDEELNAGDILYIPIGYPHDGVSLTESLSYSIGFRTPTSQELLTGFADYVLDNVPKGIFYQDPNLKLSEKPYQINAYEIEMLKLQMHSLIDDNNLFIDWFGKQTSQPMHELNIIALEPPYSLDELIEEVDNGAHLCRVPSIRIFKLNNKGYVNGEIIELPEPYIDLLCQKDELFSEDLNDKTLLEGLLELVNKGFWYFE